MSISGNESRRKQLFDKAYALLEKKQYQSTIEAYRKLIDEFPDHALGHFNLGIALQAENETEAAFYAFQKATQIDPKFTKAHTNIGVILEGQDRFNDAIAVYRQALSIDSTNGNLHANLCNALIRIKENEEAVAAGVLAVKFNPNLARAHNNLGLAYLNCNRFESAEACFKQALSLEPDMRLATGNMAVVLHKQYRLYESRIFFKKALQKYPGHAQTQLNYSWLLTCLGLWSESVEMSVSAMEILVESIESIELASHRKPPTKLYPTDCLEALVRFRNILAGHGIELFLVYGTLLGCIREKCFISYDSDIDVGIWDDAPIVPLIKELEENGFELHLSINKNDSKTVDDVLASTINLPFYYKGKIPIDVYRHFRNEEKILSGFEIGGQPMLYEVTDFKLHEVDFLGEPFQAPIDYDTYLTECYGNWREPTSLFETTISSPNIVGGFPEHARSLAYYRAAEKLAKNRFEDCFYILSSIAEKEEKTSSLIIQLLRELETKILRAQD